MKIEKEHYYQIKGLRYFSILLKVAFLLYLTGFLNNNPPFLLYVNNIIKIILSLFLVYRFNRWRNPPIVFNKLDRVTIYSIGIYVLIISFSELLLQIVLFFRYYIIQYREEITQYLQKKYSYYVQFY